MSDGEMEEKRRSKKRNLDGLRPCRKCGEALRIKIHDCGYSSFNVGNVTCQLCKHSIRVNDAVCIADYKQAWNNDKPDELERLRAANKRLRAALRALANTATEESK